MYIVLMKTTQYLSCKLILHSQTPKCTTHHCTYIKACVICERADLVISMAHFFSVIIFPEHGNVYTSNSKYAPIILPQ